MSPGDERSRVYLVDDDAGIRGSVDLLLELLGYEVHTFATGEEFLAACQSDWVGCLVLDLHLTGVSGIEVLQRMAEQNVRLPTIVATSERSEVVKPLVARFNPVAVLEKPTDSDELVAAIREALGS